MEGQVKTATKCSSCAPAFSSLLQRKCACGGSAGLTGECTECQSKRLIGKPLQGKLRINEPGDEYEREADQVAEQVTRMAEPNEESGSSQLGATALVQKRVADESNASNVQRQEETTGGQQTPEAVQQNEGGEGKEEGSRCPSWRLDPQSISKRAAENYVQNDMTPPSHATVEKIDCEPPIANGNYGCYVHFSDGLVIRVIVREKDIVVGPGPGPFTTLTPPPGTPLCFYDYACPEGLLVLTKRECKSAKPAASSGPTLVGQRRAAPGASGSLHVAPAVGRVLDTPGQPLDAAMQSFFAARFGHDFSHVRVHADAQAAESARSINALAYTVGSHVVFGPGQYSPRSTAGQKLLAHELAHVVQQSGDTGAMTAGIDGGASDPFEQAADRFAEKITSNDFSAAAPSDALARLSAPALQRYSVPGNLACSEVVDWLNANSPYAPEWAETKCTYSFNGGLNVTSENVAGGIKLRAKGHNKLTVSVDCPVDRPEWSPSRRANRDAEVTAWRNMRQVLDAHESEHRKIGRTWKGTLEGRFRAEDVTVTGTDAADARQKLVDQVQADQKSWTADAQAAQDAIDPFRGAILDCP